MSVNSNFKPVLLRKEQYSRLEEMQSDLRKKSPLGIAPSIHEIARGLVNKALNCGVLNKTTP